MLTPNQLRPTGVTIPEGQRAEAQPQDHNLPTLSVHNFGKLEMFAGQYVDSSGKLNAGFYVKFGDEFYLDPNGPAWFGGLKPLSDRHKQAVRARYESMLGNQDTTDVPTEDEVDVVAGEMANPQPEPTPVDTGDQVDVLPPVTPPEG